MTKMKCDSKVVYSRSPDIPQKTLPEYSHSLEETWNNVVVNQYKNAG